MSLLLNQGIDINATDDRNNTALHWAVGQMRLEAVKLLVENGADKSLKDNFGRTPLDAALARLNQPPSVYSENENYRDPKLLLPDIIELLR